MLGTFVTLCDFHDLLLIMASSILNKHSTFYVVSTKLKKVLNSVVNNFL